MAGMRHIRVEETSVLNRDTDPPSPCCDNQGKSEYVGWISEELETHATVYQPPGHSSSLPSFIRNHGLLTQEDFLRLMRRAKVR